MAIVRGRRLGGGEDASVPWLRSIGAAGKPALHAVFTGCKEAGGGESGMGNVHGDSYQMSARGGCNWLRPSLRKLLLPLTMSALMELGVFMWERIKTMLTIQRVDRRLKGRKSDPLKDQYRALCRLNPFL